MGTSRSDSPLAGRLYSCRDAAKFLDISDDTVRRMIHGGHLEAVRIGRRCLRVLGESIENYIQQHKEAKRLVVHGKAKTAKGGSVSEGGEA
jgi:excisionase family DNA binding protein